MVLLLLVEFLWALDVPIDEVKKEIFKDSISVNSKIIQLSSAKENVMARLGGKINKYLVKEGQSVKRGQSIAKVESLELAKLFSELKLLRKQLLVHNKNYRILKKLYISGLESMQNVNKEERERDETASRIESIKEQLRLMGLDSIAKAKSYYTIYAQGSGKVAKILVPTNSVVDANTPLVSIVKGGESFLVKSYVPLNYAADIKIGQKGSFTYAGKDYPMHVSQILPELDEETQQIIVLSSLDKEVKNLFVNTYIDSKLYIGESKSYLAVKKSALAFFNNEWVVFVPKESDESDAHDDHAGHDHAKHETLDDAHDDHGHAEEEEIPYDIRVIKVLKKNSNWVAIEGLDEHAKYVSDKSYYIKSMLLKSSLGGHGH